MLIKSGFNEGKKRSEGSLKTFRIFFAEDLKIFVFSFLSPAFFSLFIFSELFLSKSVSLAENFVVPHRIEKIFISRDQVHQIFIAFGRSMILQFPCNIMNISTGPTKDIEAFINDKDPRVIEVWLAKLDSLPSGLKVSCKDEFFSFDVTPSMEVHQDILIVAGSVGVIPFQSEYKNSEIKLKNQSEDKNEIQKSRPENLNKILPKSAKLLSSSQSLIPVLNGDKKGSDLVSEQGFPVNKMKSLKEIKASDQKKKDLINQLKERARLILSSGPILKKGEIIHRDFHE